MPHFEGTESFVLEVQGLIQTFLLVIEAYKQGVLTQVELVGLLVEIIYQSGELT